MSNGKSRPVEQDPSGNHDMRNQNTSKSSVYKANAENNPPNIILITLDAFNYEIFVDNLEMLPNLKALKEQSVFFKNAFSIGPSTVFAFPGIIASVYPYHFGIGIDKNIKAIDEILKDCGYNTAVINEANALLTPFFGYCLHTDYQKHFLNLSHAAVDRGIADTFLKGKDETEPSLDLRHEWLRAKINENLHSELIRKCIERCLSYYRFFRLYITGNTESFKEREKLYREFRSELIQFIHGGFKNPQFLWIHTIINHLPYFPPNDSDEFGINEVNYLNYRGLSQLVNRGISQKLKKLHAESMKTTDMLIGDIIDNLRSKDLLNNSLIIITADHGEEFMEEGHFGHSPASSSDRLLHVPLIFYYPGILKPGNVSTPVSTIDIVPTICGLLDLGKPGTARGISLEEILSHIDEDLKEDEDFWGRPMFSEAWATNGLLDRDPGYKSKRRILTVRKGEYKLRVIQKKNRNAIGEEFELSNWINNEKLDVRHNSRIVEDLNHLLQEHIMVEGAFANHISNRAERQRVRNKLRTMVRKR